MAPFLVPLGALFVYASLLFCVAIIRKDNGLADVGYGGAVMVAALAAVVYVGVDGLSFAAYVLTCLTFVWGTRLAVRIHRKNRGKPEDFRYRAWREAWGSWFLVRSFFQIYLLQAFIAYLIALPVLCAVIVPLPSFSVNILGAGLLVWCIGFYFEVRGDHELDTFLKDPQHKGKIMTEGLWKYSRHPNYFGESLMWWAMALMSSGAASYGLFAFVSPLLITYLLLCVSGVPLLEKRWAGRPEWETYKARTSVFFPFPPR